MFCPKFSWLNDNDFTLAEYSEDSKCNASHGINVLVQYS
jgi:hypothetical protein